MNRILDRLTEAQLAAAVAGGEVVFFGTWVLAVFCGCAP